MYIWLQHNAHNGSFFHIKTLWDETILTRKSFSRSTYIYLYIYLTGAIHGCVNYNCNVKNKGKNSRMLLSVLHKLFRHMRNLLCCLAYLFCWHNLRPQNNTVELFAWWNWTHPPKNMEESLVPIVSRYPCYYDPQQTVFMTKMCCLFSRV